MAKRRTGLRRAASLIRRQKRANRRAGALGPALDPAGGQRDPRRFSIAPAEVPEVCPRSSAGRLRGERSSTPQVKAPWAPPPCRARLTGFAVRRAMHPCRGCVGGEGKGSCPSRACNGDLPH